MHCLPQKLKSTLFEIFFERSVQGQRSEKKFQTMLILVFDVIVQPPKTIFLTFSSETKIIKIMKTTHSAQLDHFEAKIPMQKSISAILVPI